MMQEILKRISTILPRVDAWRDIGDEMELTLHGEDAWHIENNAQTTMALDASIVPHTVQLPVVKRRKKRRNV